MRGALNGASHAEGIFGMPIEEWLRLTGENQWLMRDWHAEMMALGRTLRL